MKKSLILVLFSFAFLNLVPLYSSADVIPPNSHSLNRCVKIVNLNEFPDIVLVGYITGPMTKDYEAFKIKNNECLSKGYKFNTLDIYWTTTDKFNLIDLKEINPKDLTLLTNNINSFGGHISNDNPLVKEDIEYSLTKNPGNKLVFFKSKQVSEYNNGDLIKTEIFDSPQITEVPDIKEPKQDKENEISEQPDENVIENEQKSNQETTDNNNIKETKRGFWKSITCFFSGLFGNNCK